jgi:hypothetical protein
MFKEVVPFIERIVYSVTSFAKREFLFSRSRAGTSYSATIPAKKDAHAHFQSLMNLYNQTFLHMFHQHHVAIEDFQIYK